MLFTYGDHSVNSSNMSCTILYFSVFALITQHALGDPQVEHENNVLPKEEERFGLKPNGRPQGAKTSYKFLQESLVVPTPDPQPYNGDRCYSCSDCEHVYPNTTVKQCSVPGLGCVSYAEKYHYLNRPIYFRGCISDRSTCAEIRKSHEETVNAVKLLYCKECHNDLCNGVARSLPDFVSGLLLFIITPVLTKYALT